MKQATPPPELTMFLGGKHAPGDFWGALAAMLVALPAAIAFGVTIYAAIGPSFAPAGALAGVVGAAMIGLIAAIFGGTDRLISAPCAPAAAVLAAFAIELVRQGTDPNMIVLLLVMLGLLAGLIQMLLGFIGIGRLIKYIPYPVVSGYMSGVGLIIIGSQIPKFLGADSHQFWLQIVIAPETWDWRSIAIGMATIAVGLATPKITQRVPGTILGILAGVATYFGLASQDASMLDLHNNGLVIGPLGVSGEGYFEATTSRWKDIGDLHLAQIAGLFGNALTLAILLSIDTLKTCVVLYQLTRTSYNSNRELVAQGLSNVASAAIGGIPGAGTMGATLVNLTSGAQTRASSILEGILALVATLLLGSFIAWIPVAALAGTLIVIGVRMIDREPLRFIESRATVFDFAVVLSVIIVALTIGLIAASGVGVAMATILFVREQIGGTVVRRKVYVNQMSSNWYRPEAETRILEQKGTQAVIFELQGSLFFGTTQQFHADIEAELNSRHFVIFDFKRVQSLDVTAAHLLRTIRDTLCERGALLILSNVRENLPNGRNLVEFLEQTGVLCEDENLIRSFPSLDEAIEWVEDRILGEQERTTEPESLMQLHEMEVFRRNKDETLKDLEARMEQRSFKAGETIYSNGEAGDAVYWIRRGAVRIFAPIGGGKTRHIASYGRGDFFGGLAFLENHQHINDAVAYTDTEVYILSRELFNRISEEHKKLAFNLMTALARTLAMRLRHADLEMTMLREY